MSQHCLLDIFSWYSRQSTSDIFNEILSISLGKNFVPESTRLFIMTISVCVRMSTNLSWNLIFIPSKIWILFWTTYSVWLIICNCTLISIYRSCTISLIISNSYTIRAVDWNLLKVCSKSIPMSIWIWEKSSL
jgi:hypothetical protein